MKSLLLLSFLLISAARADEFPAAPFTFIGIPEKVGDEVYQTIDGPMQSIVIKVIEVKKGVYKEKEIGFGFSKGSKPPLEIGDSYLFDAVYDRHGIRYTNWKKTEKEPNKTPQTIRTFGPHV